MEPLQNWLGAEQTNWLGLIRKPCKSVRIDGVCHLVLNNWAGEVHIDGVSRKAAAAVARATIASPELAAGCEPEAAVALVAFSSSCLASSINPGTGQAVTP